MSEKKLTWLNITKRLKENKKPICFSILLQVIGLLIIFSCINLEALTFVLDGAQLWMLLIGYIVLQMLLTYIIFLDVEEDNNKLIISYCAFSTFCAILFIFLLLIIGYPNGLIAKTKILKLDYTNNQIVLFDTNQKIVPLFKWNNYNTKKGIDNFKESKFCINNTFLRDDDNNYYIVYSNYFSKEFSLKEIIFNENTKSIKYIYENKENKLFYKNLENMPQKEFNDAFNEYNTIQKVKISILPNQ